MDWMNWKSQWRSTRKLKHAEVKGQPVAGTGKRRRYGCSGCSWCKPASDANRTALERDARKFQQEAD